MRVYRITNQLKGDQLFYRPIGILGVFIVWFAGKFSHTSTAISKTTEIDASVEFRGVTENPIDWSRHPTIIPLPFDESAHDASVEKFADAKYGKGQVVSKGLVIITGWDMLLCRKNVDCAERGGDYLSRHWLYAKVVGAGMVSKRMQKKFADPSSLTPKDVFRLAKAMAWYHTRSTPITKYVV